MNAAVIIPAFNEEASIGKVINDIPKHLNAEVIVVSNASTDKTEEVSKAAGAIVLKEPVRGYGKACLKGIQYLKEKDIYPDIVVFLDGDYSDYPEEIIKIIAPIKEGKDLVIGSRGLGNREKKSMLPQQIIGNWLATSMIKWIYGYQYTDLGPFRAIRWNKLLDIDMVDQNYGWTVEMQVKAIKSQLNIAEVPVSYRVRIGDSKVSGTFKGTMMAGYKIISTIIKYL